MNDIDCMTFYEYELRMRAYRLKTVDDEYRIYLQAWVNREIKAERRKGKTRSEPVYKRFEDFFNYENRLKSVLGKELERKPSSRAADRYVEFMERRKINGEL